MEFLLQQAFNSFVGTLSGMLIAQQLINLFISIGQLAGRNSTKIGTNPEDPEEPSSWPPQGI
jgi:hypothetical protein